MSALVVSTLVIFIAELGDKSQLMAMTLATRFRALTVILAITTATAAVHLLSVAVGATIAELVPATALTGLAGAAFVAFGLWTLRGDHLTEGDNQRSHRVFRSAFVGVTLIFLLAELGDKTMLATVTLATGADWFWVWIGSTAGMVAADALAIGVGALLARTLPERTVRIGAATLFLVIGASLIVTAAIQLAA